MGWMLKFCNGFAKLFLFFFFQGNLSNYKILKTWLQGLDPNLGWSEAALVLYEKEVGPKPEKVCHFEIFSSMCSQENLE